MTAKFRKTSNRRKEKTQSRLKNDGGIGLSPMFGAERIRYELSEKTDATVCGGIGVIHKMNQVLGLPGLINSEIQLLSVHKPYFDSDHILNMAYNIIVGGKYIEDINVRRHDTAYIDALGATRIPSPTTAGDFLRRFKDEESIEKLFKVNNDMIQKVWKITNNWHKRKQGILRIDGKIVETLGEFKENMDMSYKGIWGFSTLILTEATTGVHLAVVNRSGNIVSQSQAEYWLTKAIKIMKKHFDEIIVTGDSAYYLTEMLDRLDIDGIKFDIAVDQFDNLIKSAENIDEKEWTKVEREKPSPNPRFHKHENVKEKKIAQRGYKHIVQREEYLSEFSYSPPKCKNTYRIIVVRQLKEQMQYGLFNWYFYQYRFAITNIRDKTKRECLNLIRTRADHENKIEQLESGVFALNMPAKEFYANQAYTVIAAMAWNMKSWLGLLSPDKEFGEKLIRMEFKNFKLYFINIPAQIIKLGRYIVYRLLGFNPYIENLMLTFDRICKLKFG